MLRTPTKRPRSLPCCASSSNVGAKRWPIWKCSWPPCRPSRPSTRRVCHEQPRALADRDTQAVHRLPVGHAGRAHLSLPFADSRHCARGNNGRRVHRGVLGYCSPHADRFVCPVCDAAAAGLQGAIMSASQPIDCTVAQLALALPVAVAVAGGQLDLHYQPIVDLRSDQIVGAEALLRWRLLNEALETARNLISIFFLDDLFPRLFPRIAVIL